MLATSIESVQQEFFLWEYLARLLSKYFCDMMMFFTLIHLALLDPLSKI